MKKLRNRFIIRFLVMGVFAYPVLVFVSNGLALIGAPNYYSPFYNFFMILVFLLSPGALLMMDTEAWRGILLTLPFVTVLNALWYAFMGAGVWYIRKFLRSRASS